jgi:hypothetical protein
MDGKVDMDRPGGNLAEDINASLVPIELGTQYWGKRQSRYTDLKA